MTTSYLQHAFASNTCGRDAVSVVKQTTPNVFGVFVRNKNGNIVVLEAVVEVKSRHITNVDSYWLDLEPSYKAAARKKGRLIDRESLGFMDTVYGFTYKSVSPTHIVLTMNKVRNKPLHVRLTADGCVAEIMLRNELCTLQYIYVHDRTNSWGIPYVEYLEIYGTTKQGVRISERL